MAITNVQIKNVDTNLLLVPAGKRYAVTAIMICNTFSPDPSDENLGITSLDMHFISAGDPISDANMVLNSLELRAGETFSFDTEKIILDAGDKVTMIATPELITTPISVEFLESQKSYIITTSGDTDFTTVGASDSNVGTIFIATGPGTGSGEARLYGYTALTATSSFLEL